jgi:hypothetical protein
MITTEDAEHLQHCFLTLMKICNSSLLPMAKLWINISTQMFCGVHVKTYSETMLINSTLAIGGWILHHDNAPAHSTLSVQEFWATNSMTVVTHPPTIHTPHF